MTFSHKKKYKYTQTVPTTPRKPDSFYNNQKKTTKKKKTVTQQKKTVKKEKLETKASPPPTKITVIKTEKFILHFKPLPKTKTYDSDAYTTPSWLVTKILHFTQIDIDCCADINNCIVPTFYSTNNSFLITFFINKICFINPPFSKILPFIKHSIKLYLEGNNKFVFLIPGSGSTKYYQLLMDCGAVFYKFRRNLQFGHPTKTDLKRAPFSCELATLGFERRFVSGAYIREDNEIEES